MAPFEPFISVAAAMPMVNIDTDKIIPARFMKTIVRKGLGINLFYALRYDDDGRERPEFVLNCPPFDSAHILIAYDNFGCGSSREHAVWALLDFGIRVIIAPSFGDIFAANCLKNAIVPICLSRDICGSMMKDALLGLRFGVDLVGQTVKCPSGDSVRFDIDPLRKALLLAGHDDIQVTLNHMGEIANFERSRAADDWLYPSIGIKHSE
jgi:3-isopropylmalate/(R)-2-methylmalate dehydratase small subunit